VEDSELPRGSQAIVRAIGVLGAFSTERSALTTTEIAGEIGVSVPTAHRIAKTLESHGYLTRDRETKAFSLGPEVLRLAKLMTDTRPTRVTTQTLAAIREATGETVSLHIRVGDHRICIAEEVSRQPIRITSGVGQSYPLTAGAAGKAILSLLPDDEVERLVNLPPAADCWPLPTRELLASVRQARELGYVTSEGETVRGSIAVAVPLPWSGTDAPSAVNLVGPRDRMTRAAIENGLAAMRASVEALSTEQA
jgi:DNA-binding IclR family transcriptional regulator